MKTAGDGMATNPGPDVVSAGTPGVQGPVLPTAQPALATVDQIAFQETHGYWEGLIRHFDLSAGNTVTVNITGLTSAEQNLARSALALWSDVTGIVFQEKKSSLGVQIGFSHSEGQDGPVASTSSQTQGEIIYSSYVHISSSWVENYGTALNSYSFQSYVHEIGHALGLGHTGNYNTTADWNTESLFSNDSWSMSIMSYFDQDESSYFDSMGFTRAYAVTPMQADIVAMQSLYGLTTAARTGDTVYGYNSNAGSVYDAVAYPKVALTIVDSGGNDTIDYSGSSASQLINLNAETFSNVNGYTGNLAIARGVVIENAIGGSGADTLTGNAVNNFLSGGDGNDFIDGGLGSDTLAGGAGDDRIVYDAADAVSLVTGGAGTDTLVVNGGTLPVSFNLVAQGFEGAEWNQVDTGSNSWSTIRSNYNSSWQMLNQDVRNDNGSHTYTAFDSTGAQNWDQVWFNYDAAGQQVSVDYRYDDGTRSWTALDPYNAQSWSQVWYTYNTSGQQISEDYRYDDGKRSWVSLDATNSQNWSQVWFTYDPAGNKVSEDYRYDDGGRSWVAFDATSAHPWDHIWFTYDAAGHQTSEDRYNDNGTRTWTAYDANSSYAWSQDAFYYDASGHLYQQVRTWDDGHTSTTIF